MSKRREFTRRQPVVNASVTSIWQDRPTGAAYIRTRPSGGRRNHGHAEDRDRSVDSVGRGIAPLQQGVSFAQPAPGAMATQAMVSSVSAADKDALMKKLQEAKKHDKIARAGWSQEPIRRPPTTKRF